jgi:N-acetylglucosaminyldiphosphoundecaprenol N-acetyl-beta-D-mannosaminyltransferase
MRPMSARRAAHVLGVAVDAVNMEEALKQVSALLQSPRKGYVCVAGVHNSCRSTPDQQ